MIGLPTVQSVDMSVPWRYCLTLAGSVRATQTVARGALITTLVIASNPLATSSSVASATLGRGSTLSSYAGRTSGRTYHTPINVFRRGDEYVFALTYGSDVQWVKNVLAAGGCEIRVRGRDERLVEPEMFVDPARRLMPPPVRLILRLNHVTEFLRMRAAVDDIT